MTAPAMTHADAYVEHFRQRFLQELLAEATDFYWQRRALQFSGAAPRATDYTGQASTGELADRATRCASAAQACRNKASLAPLQTEIEAEAVADAIAEVA